MHLQLPALSILATWFNQYSEINSGLISISEIGLQVRHAVLGRYMTIRKLLRIRVRTKILPFSQIPLPVLPPQTRRVKERKQQCHPLGPKANRKPLDISRGILRKKCVCPEKRGCSLNRIHGRQRHRTFITADIVGGKPPDHQRKGGKVS